MPVHANSRVQDVSNFTEFIPISHLYTNLFLSNSTEFILISHLYTNLFFGIQKKIRQVKAAKQLFKSGDEKFAEYEQQPLLKVLADRLYHSPKLNETNLENMTKSIIAVYDYS